MFKTLLLCAITCGALSQNRQIVTTTSGQLSGVREFSLFNSYFNFKGIPYAEPPVGELRFRNPIPHKGWTGVRDASYHRDHCPNDGFQGIGSGGHEDCLFLNVYTENLRGMRPVMFWIHGGAFQIGDGDDLIYNPRLILREGVVVVSVNYRLASLGFLSTGDKHAQGNYGLKDLVVALKWVRKNIGAFGGDPEKITVFGQSAGAVAVHMLLLTKKSIGLFQQAIMMSGSAFAPFAVQRNPLARAEDIARRLKLKFDSTETLVSELRKLDYSDIVSAQRGFSNMESPLGLRSMDFVPNIEPIDSLEERFLTEDPTKLMIEGKYHQIPLIIGTTSNEGLLMVRQYLIDSSVFNDYNQNPHFFVPDSYNLTKDSEDAKKVYEAFKEVYFKGQSLSRDSLHEWARFHTDAQFKFPALRAMKYFSQNHTMPLYTYNFSFSGALNWLKTILFLTQYEGACHADDLFYQFDPRILPTWPGSHAIEVRKRYVRLFANFAKFGNPTPQKDELIKVIWPKYSASEEHYLEIGHDLSVGQHQENLEMWMSFQKQFTGNW